MICTNFIPICDHIYCRSNSMLSQRALNCPGNFVTLKNLSGKSFYCQIIIVQIEWSDGPKCKRCLFTSYEQFTQQSPLNLEVQVLLLPDSKKSIWILYISIPLMVSWLSCKFNEKNNTYFQCNSFNIILRLQIFLHCPPVPVPVNNGGLWINNKEPAAAAGSTLGHNAPPTTLCMCVLQRTF